MFSRLRNRFGVPGVIAVFALVFAMIGGAYAASNGLTGKQKKEVEKISKKYAGKNGAPGANGTNGINGKDGAPGTNGTNGAAGKSVKVTPIAEGEDECEELGGAMVQVEGAADGTEVCNGEEGPEGSPWTVGGVLPSGKTETGTWAVGNIPSPATYPGAGKFILLPISFPIPLESDLASSQTHLILENGKEFSAAFTEVDSAACHGTVSAPSADPGNLCVYAGKPIASPSTGFSGILINPATGFRKADGTPGVSVSGLVIRAEALSSDSESLGSWAVTAPAS